MSEPALPIISDRSTPLWSHKMSRGAASELTASAYLMAQGWDVYRALAPNSPFDLVAHRGGELLRVEVKSVSWPPQGTGPTFPWPRDEEWDLLLVVDDGGLCTEIRTHDRDHGRDQVCAHHGYPLPKRFHNLRGSPSFEPKPRDRP